MRNLTSTPALSGLPVEIGRTRLAAMSPGQVTSVSSFPGADLGAELSPLGLSFPAPGETQISGAARIIWAGRETAFLIGTPPPQGLEAKAAITDQTDGWAWVTLSGADATEVLARHVSIDLRETALPVQGCARAQFGHMQALIIRTAPDSFEIAVYRSMAGTLKHELTTAMTQVAARRPD